MLADAVEFGRAYDIDCPALLLCGEKDRAGDVKVFIPRCESQIRSIAAALDENERDLRSLICRN